MSDLTPRRDQTILYRYFNDYGELLYVGITSEPARRMFEHSRHAAWWQSTRGGTFVVYDSREEALAAEEAAIREERPLFNASGPGIAPPARHPRCAAAACPKPTAAGAMFCRRHEEEVESGVRVILKSRHDGTTEPLWATQGKFLRAIGR